MSCWTAGATSCSSIAAGKLLLADIEQEVGHFNMTALLLK